MDVTTLGMFTLDEIHHPPPRPPSVNIPGGAGTYAAFGARLFRPRQSSHKVGLIVHKGWDFPREVERTLKGWEAGIEWIDTPERRTTAAWNGYVEDQEQERSFRFMTPRVQVTEEHLTDDMLLSRCFHMVCRPERCIDLVKGIRAKREHLCSDERAIQEPVFVWEPMPDSCTPGKLDDILEAARYVDVVSPNHTELGALFAGLEEVQALETDIMRMDACCEVFLGKESENRTKVVVVRCGKNGCYIRSGREHSMLPAVHQPGNSREKVVDPTGAGNTFLGGFCVGLIDEPLHGLTHLESAAVYGTVAASFAVEQIGFPEFKVVGNQELWNGQSAKDRIDEFLKRR